MNSNYFRSIASDDFLLNVFYFEQDHPHSLLQKEKKSGTECQERVSNSSRRTDRAHYFTTTFESLLITAPFLLMRISSITFRDGDY